MSALRLVFDRACCLIAIENPTNQDHKQRPLSQFGTYGEHFAAIVLYWSYAPKSIRRRAVAKADDIFMTLSGFLADLSRDGRAIVLVSSQRFFK
jgi:hypothetical protein